MNFNCQARRNHAAISPGIIVTPLADDELHGEHADFHQTMLKKMPAGRAGTPTKSRRWRR